MAASPQNNNNQNTNIDPLALTNGVSVNPVANQATQQDIISQLEFEDSTGITIKGILGGLPVAEKNQEYFLITEEAGDTAPEIIDQTQFKISYLCDSQLNVSKPSGDSIALNNVIQNFERQKNAIVRVDQGTVLNNQLAGTHKITAVGSVEPICGTQIGFGPLDYVTTMSFQLKDQLGNAPGVQVATYYAWLNKTVGFQNLKLAYNISGTIPFGDQAWTNPDNTVYQASSEYPFRAYFDSNQIDTGSAISTISSPVPNPGGSPPNGIDDLNTNYFNVLRVDTGSFVGNTRIKLKGAFGINIASSSVYDLYASALQLGGGGGIGNVGSDEGRGGQGASGDDSYTFFQPITMNLYKRASNGTGEITLLATGKRVINTRNLSLANSSGGGLSNASAESLSTGDIDDITDFSWQPDSVTYFSLESDYFSVNVNDYLYAELVLPEEISSSTAPINVNDAAYFTSSLQYWKTTNTYREYQYFGGYLIINQETPEGANFVHGVTGVTASYFTTQSDGFVSQSVYNNTGSYFVGYNNFTSSEDATFGLPQCYVTASTPLSLFYGGDYTQVNPASEIYNTLNASVDVTSSLGTGLNKKTWTRFGFNPIQKSFVPQPGDFIRFEYAKSKVYQILKVSSINNVLKLLLDNHIDDGTVVDNFVIYRIVEDGQFLILDVKKNVEAGIDQKFTGLVQPQFPSEGLRAKSNTLLFDLKQAGIIES